MKLEIGDFEIKDKDLGGRIGKLQTPSGAIETPALFPVIDPARQELPIKEIESIGFKQVITNAYLLWKRSKIEEERDIHDILGFKGIVMTDSGAYQILRYGEIDVDPITIVEFQKKIRSDIAVILDYPTGNARTRKQAEESVKETLKRAKKSLEYIDDERIWVLPIQGGEFLDLVQYSARESAKLEKYSLYALGSPTVHMEKYNYSTLLDMIYTARINIPLAKPLHLFGAGHPMIIPFAIALGVDAFDSASYILYARDNRYITLTRTYRLEDIDYFPCSCPVCNKYTPRELLDMPKPERTRLLALHNLYVLKQAINEAKLAIREGRLWELLEERSRAHPSLYTAFQNFKKYAEWLEKIAPFLKGGEVHGLFFFNKEGLWRPRVLTYYKRLLKNYRPRKKEKLILLPWIKIEKPLTTSKLYKTYSEKEPEAHIAFYVPYLALIPEELAETYPLTHFELPDSIDIEVLKETGVRIAAYLNKNSNIYNEIIFIGINNNHHEIYKSILGNLNQKLKAKIKMIEINQ